MTGEVLFFDQKEAPKVVMLDECVEANFEKYQEENLREEMESDEDNESEGSQEFNNDKVIEEILDMVNPDHEDETQDGTVQVRLNGRVWSSPVTSSSTTFRPSRSCHPSCPSRGSWRQSSTRRSATT